MNAATSLGIGSCWIPPGEKVFASEEGKALLKKMGREGDYEGIGTACSDIRPEMCQRSLVKKLCIIVD